MDKRKLIRRAAIGFGSFSIGCMALGVALRFLPEDQYASSSIGGFRAPQVGQVQFVGKRNCDKAVQMRLRDPGSYQHISAQIIDVKPGEGWVAEMSFRARNGFGGMDVGTAHCLFDGKEYRALVMN